MPFNPEHEKYIERDREEEEKKLEKMLEENPRDTANVRSVALLYLNMASRFPYVALEYLVKAQLILDSAKPKDKQEIEIIADAYRVLKCIKAEKNLSTKHEEQKIAEYQAQLASQIKKPSLLKRIIGFFYNRRAQENPHYDKND